MSRVRRVAIALVHHPVEDRQRAIVTTAVTNLDVHDIARSGHTYGVSDFFIVHPVAAQRVLVQRIRDHWVDGSGARRIPDRKPAMECVRIVATLEEARAALGESSELWVTSASSGPAKCLQFDEARGILRTDGSPVLLCFGTGWGLAPSVLEVATRRLSPIRSPRTDGYNHLSVRAAAAIILDRLLAGD